ncbi:4-hydroxybenzoate transporter (plasmid) [Pseudomonas sp. XWY-1]|uniref:MFS transporter n=1 Tax=unclassified Pseudomonas TaxID=196821 RepID=UPI00068F5785|nr:MULTISPECIES: MFS transporter [unclassified Pseudomonas]AMK37599.1 4-hydroxy benzoate transporter [Pseudomonas sp. C5pp]AUZ62259.1 4-hydroxybenzoate transporter [Pseudomonas sp. XWY-1]
MNHSTAVDVSSLIDKALLGGYQIRVIVLCAIIAMLDGFDTQSIAYVAPAIASDWGLPSSSFGPVFGIGLLGLTCGALLFGPLADKFGRRRIVVLTVFLFGVFAFLTAFSSSFIELLLLRFLTGVGLGGAMPNIIALTSEYSPKRLRATMITLMFAGFPLGSMMGGFISAEVIPAWGWQAVFYIGGALPLLLIPILYFMLPESIRFMCAQGGRGAQIAGILRRLAPVASINDSTKFYLPEEHHGGFAVRHLFRDGRTSMTLLIWVAFFMNLLVMYFLVNWLPSLLKAAGLPLKTAILGTALLNAGGVIGSLLIARLIDRLNPFAVLANAYALAACFIAVSAIQGLSSTLLLGAIFFSGFGIVGAQLGINAVVADLYPTAIRSTGIGWALGIGRVGSILGPIFGGVLLSIGWEGHSIVMITVIPSLAASIAVGALGYTRRINLKATHEEGLKKTS